jgi:hypothetical protein
MFSPSEVDELFFGTTRALQRSQVLLDERRRTTAVSAAALPSIFCPSSSSAASTAVGAGAAPSYGSSSSGSFVETVRSLQSLSAFRAFVEATTAMQDKVERELRSPSSALQQRRARGHDFALLQSITRGLRGATAAAPWRTSDSTAALWSGEAAADDDEDGGEGGDVDAFRGGAVRTVGSSAMVAPPSAETLFGFRSGGHVHSSGAQITATLLFGAVCVDVGLTVPRSAPTLAECISHIFADGGGSSSANGGAALVVEWLGEGSGRLRALLQDVTALLPKRVAGRFVSCAANLLLYPLPHSASARADAALFGCRMLSGGQFLLPAFNTYLLEHYPSSLAARWFVRPLQVTAQNLRADYYRSAADFARQCRWLLSLHYVLVRGCQMAAAAFAAEEESSSLLTSTTPMVGRHLRIAQRICDAWLMPLEKTFGHEAARHDMSTHFFESLVLPHAQLIQQLQANRADQRAEVRSSGSRGTTRGAYRTWSSVLCTAQYRLLMIVEKLAQWEVAQANGTSSTAAKQRTYEALLRQNGGKVSVSLLQTLAEDKQLVLEETPSRSPDGHRLYRLHDGMLDGGGGGSKAVFVYVDDGAFFMKVGRSRMFQRVKSVEDIFRPLQ